MTENQDLLDAEMGPPPPSAVDVDAVIVRQRRRVRLRQAGLIGSATAMTMVVFLVLTLLPRAGGTPAIRAGEARTRPPTSSPSPTSTPATPATPREREAARLTGVLTRLMATTLPNAEFQPPPDFLFFRGETPPREALVFVDEGTYFLAGAQIKDSAGLSTITVAVGKEPTQFRNDRACFTDPAPLDMHVSCQFVPGSGGSIMEAVTSSSKYTMFKADRAEIIRLDGNAVDVGVANRSGDEQHQVFRPMPPLTLNQTIALTTNTDLATTLPS